MNEIESIKSILNNDIEIKTNKLYVEITNKCNLTCAHCYNESNNGKIEELPLSVIEELIVYARLNQIKLLALSGGEALLHTQIEQIFEIAKINGIELMILTNGTVFNKHNMELILKYKPAIQVSIDGSNKSINDKIRGEGSFDKTVSFIKTLKQINYSNDVSINSVLTEERIDDIVSTKKLSNELDVNYLSFGMVCKIGRATKNHINMSKAYTNQIIKNVNLVVDSKCKGMLLSHNCSLCEINDKTLYLQTRVTWNGDILPCQMFHDSQYALGNLRSNNLTQILNSEKTKKFLTLLFLRKRNIQKCKLCSFQKVCGKGCMAKAIIENTDPMTTDGLCDYYISSFIKELHKNEI